jgi:hypothetical protein
MHDFFTPIPPIVVAWAQIPEEDGAAIGLREIGRRGDKRFSDRGLVFASQLRLDIRQSRIQNFTETMSVERRKSGPLMRSCELTAKSQP